MQEDARSLVIDVLADRRRDDVPQVAFQRAPVPVRHPGPGGLTVLASSFQEHATVPVHMGFLASQGQQEGHLDR